MRIVVTGGAGFLGSHLSRWLLSGGHQVLCVDDLSTGRRDNLASLLDDPRFEFHQADVAAGPLPVRGRVDAVAHLASPASPPDYHRLPLETLAVGSRGTEHALQLSAQNDARFLLASTSEVYGDPEVHPQVEDYWGNVNPVGPRSVYDEAKRYAEAVTMAYARQVGVDVGIVRIFNTYGPGMRAEDGRVVTSFITQALNGDPLTIYGDGSQTRSFCYVDDLVRGLVAMLETSVTGPVNLGNPVERTVLELARIVCDVTGSRSPIEFHPLPEDDPTRRRPDISRAERLLGWRPEVSDSEGLRRTVEWFRSQPAEVAAAAAAVAGTQYQGRAHGAATSLAGR
ncbi:SDR family NAD-dependent epimerase/dehydratase [Geodermatophilus sp. TF02-6]|uniref:UDP-glucuronic acid decarboxylase family protein n=1 Tax=Geodermatophilus sp. TF02-6 TaxID=2250575 RepID=UPI000DEA6B26|nr:UDP-glucuronic acid decarboxylase family protein [Geodermatophilus sp. TF02-6]RBY78137.1 SDR family NAD-dependent epimerase/dehydratase [Geodermatophilus sp. TF02-6]